MNHYRTSVYVDGFNFYYSIKNKLKQGVCYYPSLWKLCENVASRIKTEHYSFVEIHYFTTLVDSSIYDHSRRNRQIAYNRALDKEGVLIKLGKFRPEKVKDKSIEKHQSKEKCTDVNLAARMVSDAWQNKYDCAVLISRDSDFRGAVEIVRTSFAAKPETPKQLSKPKKRVEIWTVGNPHPDLANVADKYREIFSSDLSLAGTIANHDFAPKKR